MHRYQQVSVSDDNLGLAVERQLPNCQCVPAQDRHCLHKSSEPREAHARAKPRSSSAPSSLLVHARRVSNKMCIEVVSMQVSGFMRRPSVRAVLTLIVLGSNRCSGVFMRLSAGGRVPANREEANSDPLR